MTGRYEPSGVESEFEPGSRGRVPRNKLGIIRVRDIQLAESQMLLLAQKNAIETYGPEHRFSAEDILERQVLAKHTPCREAPIESVATALAIVHAELVLIHPFRDGNGRLARMLATLMALQARLPALKFSSFEGKGKRSYIAAIHAAVDHNYGPLTAAFAKAIDRTRKIAASRIR